MKILANRQSFSYSLRVVLLALLVLCVCLSYISRQRIHFARELNAADTLEGEYGVTISTNEGHARPTWRGGLSFSYSPVLSVFITTESDERELLTKEAIDLVSDFRYLESVIVYRREMECAIVTQSGKFQSLKLFDSSCPGFSVGVLPNTVDSLVLSKSSISDTALTGISQKCSGLKTLWIDRTDVSDECLNEIAMLDNLESLRLDDTDITDEVFVRLQGMPRLEEINLSSTAITDAGQVARFGKSTKVSKMFLDNCDIGDSFVEQLASIDGLTSIYLKGTRITDAGMRHISTIDSLTEIHLDGTEVSTKGLAFLENKSVEVLGLGETTVDDEVFRFLEKMESLELVYLNDTNVTHGAVVAFRKRNPKVKVIQ